MMICIELLRNKILPKQNQYLTKGANPNSKHGYVSYHIHTQCIVHVGANSNSCDIYIYIYVSNE